MQHVLKADVAYLSNIHCLSLAVSDGGNGRSMGMGGGSANNRNPQGAVGKLWLSTTLLQLSLMSDASAVTLKQLVEGRFHERCLDSCIHRLT